MIDKNNKIEKLKRRITGLEKTLQIVAGHSGRTESNLKHLFEVTSNTMPVPLVISTKSGDILFFNGKSQEIFGYSGKHFQSITAQDLYKMPQDRQQMLRSLIDADEVRGVTVTMKKADGSFFPASLFSRLIIFESRKCLLTVIYDLSDLRKEEEKRLTIEKQLHHTQKMEVIGTMAGGIAHDFNNLMVAILGSTQLLLMGKAEGSADYRQLKQIETASDRAVVLIRQLLAFSRKAAPHRRPMNLNKEIKQTKKILERTIPKMIAIHLNLASDLKDINADPNRIEQILLNAGYNSADAMPEGGRLSINTMNVQIDEQFCHQHQEISPGKYVRLSIEDTGHGIDDETRKHIFEPFFTTKASGRGTGLGLASIDETVKSHGGVIICSSEPGRGTTFDIFFPAIHSVSEEQTAPPKVLSVKGGTESILVVDDEENIRELAELVLEKYGYHVIKAASGEEAIDIFAEKKHQIDLIILDLGMPGIGGYKCLAELIRIDENARIVIVSGYALEGEIEKSLKAGASGFIGKPYQLEELLVKTREILDRCPPAISRKTCLKPSPDQLSAKRK